MYFPNEIKNNCCPSRTNAPLVLAGARGVSCLVRVGYSDCTCRRSSICRRVSRMVFSEARRKQMPQMAPMTAPTVAPIMTGRACSSGIDELISMQNHASHAISVGMENFSQSRCRLRSRCIFVDTVSKSCCMRLAAESPRFCIHVATMQARRKKAVATQKTVDRFMLENTYQQ